MFSKFQKLFSFILILISFIFLLSQNTQAAVPGAEKPATNPGKATVNKSAKNADYLGGAIPNCTDLNKKGCNDVTVFLTSAIGIGAYVFGIIGALALVMFVYGGIIWITASGNPEKVKQGMGIFMSAVIGLIIVFSAYMIVKYFGSNILNIGSEYRLK